VRSTATNDIQSTDVALWQLFPNPTAAMLHLQAPQDIVSYTVFSMQGQSVLTGKGTTVDLHGLSNGVYHITITTNSESKTLRFIKSNP
jgi:hypothetical protein